MQAVEVKGKNAHKTRQLRGCGNQTVKRRKARGIHDEWRVRVVFTICMRAPFETQSLIVFSRQQIARANLGRSIKRFLIMCASAGFSWARHTEVNREDGQTITETSASRALTFTVATSHIR
jgi:hypothetical protein